MWVVHPLEKVELIIDFSEVVQQDVKFDLWDPVFGGSDGLELLLDGLQQCLYLIMDDFAFHSEVNFR